MNLWVAVDQTAAWVATGYVLLGVALYVALINWSPIQKQPQWLAYGLCIMGTVMALLAPPFIQWKPRFRLFHLPLYDFFGTLNESLLMTENIHANVLAGTLVMVLPLFFALLVYARKNFTVLKEDRREYGTRTSADERGYISDSALVRVRPRPIKNSIYLLMKHIALWAGAVLILTLLILTQSRGAYLAGIVALGAVALLCWPRLLYIVPLVGCAIGWFAYQIGTQNLFELLGADNTFGGAIFRNEVWGNSVYALSDFVFTGIGIGNFNQVIPVLYPFPVINGANAYHAHNLYLQIGLDLGLPGATAYGALVINLFVMAWIALSKKRGLLGRMLVIGVIGSLVAMLIHGLLDAVTWGTKLAFVPWLFYAQVVLLSSHNPSDKSYQSLSLLITGSHERNEL